MYNISMILRVRGQGSKECWQPRQNHLSRTSVQHEVHSTTEICHDVSDHHSPGVSSSRPIFSTASAQKKQKQQQSTHQIHSPQHRYPRTNTGLRVSTTPVQVPTCWNGARRLKQQHSPEWWVPEFLGLCWVTFITIWRRSGCAGSHWICFRVDFVIPFYQYYRWSFFIQGRIVYYIKCHLSNGNQHFISNICHHHTCDPSLGHDTITNQIQI